MKPTARLALLAAACLLLAACSLKPPPTSSAHPDAPRSGPFWERSEQRD